LFNYGVGIHLLQEEISDPPTQKYKNNINPRDNHISFQCTDISRSEKWLRENGIHHVKRVVRVEEEEGTENNIEQLFFHDPDGYMIEICNCENSQHSVFPLSPTYGH
ncbi:hypothetical protein KI387_035516, partial [Taxus chinensis]